MVRRVDPLVLLTLLGLVLSGAVALLNPAEPFDHEDPERQVGRTVAIRLEVIESRHGDGWSRGLAVPEGRRPTPDAPPERVAHAVPWVWFRAEEAPVVGDLIVGRAQVTAHDGVTGVMISGPQAYVRATLGPVPIRWVDLFDRPHAYVGRTLLLTGIVHDGVLVSPDGTRTCTIDGPAPPAGVGPWALHLVPDPARPGWRCRIGDAP
ncbi:MAG: hypothetical protein KY455_12560 [Euryarchaeota archaeon]|nr:hypothetical protein [Euryarchaeota archaeon]